MTVENTQNKMPPLQMGTTNEYPFNFAVLLQDPTAEEALEAIKASVLQADGTEIELVYNTDYTVTLNTDRIGGTLTVNDIRTSGDYITIYRQYAQTQEVDYKDFNSAPAETFEQCFDKLTMLSQQQQEEINRSIKLPVSSDITNLSLPNPVAGRTLKWNESETGLINSDVSIDEIDDSVQAALEASINAKQQAEIASDAAKEVVEKVNEVDNIWSEIVEGNMFKLQFFDTVVKDHILTYEESKGLALQGTYVYKEAVAGSRYGYPDFYNKVVEEYNQATNTETVNSVTVKVHSNGHKFYDIADKTAIDEFFNTIGTAWFYGVDTANERIFLPRSNYFEQLTGDVSQVGDSVQAGLPNITGKFASAGPSGRATGVFYDTSGTTRHDSGNDATYTAVDVAIDASRSSSIYGNSNTVQPNAVKKLLYICVGNTVSDTSWVDVVTQVKGGVKDLEDKTNEGLEALANASNALRETQITNCIKEIPQRIKLELADGVLTLKAGSVITVPNGFEADGTTKKFDEIVIENDVTAPAPSVKSLVFYGVESKTLMNRDITLCLSGNSDPVSNASVYYDTSINKVSFYSSSGAKYNVAFPLAIVSGNATSIDQIFNGMGYIDKHIWAEKGIKGLIPNGRNEDGSLKNIEYITKNFIVREAGLGVNAPVVCGLADIESKGGSYFYTDLQSDIVYNEEQNFIYKKGVIDKTFLPFLTYYAGDKISNFQPKQPFRAVDYSDKQEISGWGMPSSKYIDLSLGASGTTYKAPANGWFGFISNATTANGQYCRLINTNSANSRQSSYASGTAQYIEVLLPIPKGQSVAVYYTAPVSSFRFIYAEGEQ